MTAVCFALVVAPPMSSGTVKPCSFIVRATDNHFFQRWRDQTAESNDIDLVLDRFFQNLFTRHHHAKINHLEVVTAKHDSDDILADVVHVAFDRGDQKCAAIAAGERHWDRPAFQRPPPGRLLHRVFR